jgi:photosystem II stability/assembly factor-like uncharacterized protein
MGSRALAACAWLGIAALGPAAAYAQRGEPPSEPADATEADEAQVPPGGIPEGFERVELTDLTYTMRDDTYNAITYDPRDSRIAYVGTHQGRVYKTTDRGRTWTESTVIPEQRPLWAAPGTSVFLGAVRVSGGDVASASLTGVHDSPLAFTYLPSQLRRFTSGTVFDPLVGESAAAAGGGRAQLGIGLSERSPRLQLLTATRGRPAPSTNRASYVAGRAARGTAIVNIAADPTDRRLLFAATVNGLYKSDNGGDSWARTFAGLTSGERMALRIAIRPGEPKLMILGTASGAYTSSDRGENWVKNGTVGGAVNDVAFDLDPKFVYLATNGGALRSIDGGQTFDRIYYSTFPAENDVRSISIDPFDAQTVYIGTNRGAYVTHKARTATGNDWIALEGVQSVEAIPIIATCSKHEGHLYAAVTVNLHTINYGASPPESAVIESWDGGLTWRQLFTGHSDGAIQTMALDPSDPDQLMVAWTTAVHRLERRADRSTAAVEEFERPPGPTLGELVFAALRYHGLDLEQYTDTISRGILSTVIPKRLTVVGALRQWQAGGVQDDVQFSADRFRQIYDGREWEVMAFASWDLPERIYSPAAQPMMRQRVAHVNDELRHQITNTVRRAYSELMRIRATLASTQLDLKTRVFYRLRADQLEAVIDLASGGYLARWQKKSRRNAR